MTTIKITPENVSRTGKEIQAKKQEIVDIVNRANSQINTLRGEFTGNLATQVFSKWDEIQPKLKQSYDCLEQAGQILQKASEAFAQVDSTRI